MRRKHPSEPRKLCAGVILAREVDKLPGNETSVHNTLQDDVDMGPTPDDYKSAGDSHTAVWCCSDGTVERTTERRDHLRRLPGFGQVCEVLGHSTEQESELRPRA